MERNEKTKAAILKWVKAKRLEATIFLQTEKEKRGCEKCLRPFPYYVLDLDHFDLVNKPRHRGRSNGSYVKNIDQARKLLNESQVLCAVCHRLKTDVNGDNLFNRIKQSPKGHTGIQKASFYRKLERRSKAVKEYLRITKVGPCKDCNETYPPVAMDFDHIHSKIKNMSKMATGNTSISKLKLEIAKCELVCANCHRIRTQIRKSI